LNRLLEGLIKQSVTSIEVIIAYRFSPSGLARNRGASVAKGKYLIFMDDDIGLGSEKILENLCGALDSDKIIGLAGASTLIPPDANAFQKRVAKEIPRMTFPVMDVLTESDMVTTQCWAQRRDCFEKVGPFSELIERGVDPEYRRRVRDFGYKIVIVPQTWTYHPPPIDFRAFFKQTYRNGRASARAQKAYPELVAPVPDEGNPENRTDIGLALRIFRAAWRIFSGILSLKFLQVSERLFYAAGYIEGRLKG
jgi:GT2 family glycosyltransferase